MGLRHIWGFSETTDTKAGLFRAQMEHRDITNDKGTCAFPRKYAHCKRPYTKEQRNFSHFSQKTDKPHSVTQTPDRETS
jgi:hypothetical protein